MNAFPKAALFEAGYLKQQCSEPIHYQCSEDGGDVERDGQNQLVCTICFKVIQPILRCGRCKEALVLGSTGIEGREERTCLSAQAYDKSDGNLLPAFAPLDEILWAFRTSAHSLIQIASETTLRNTFTSGVLPDTTEVSGPQHELFSLAQITAEFGEAFNAGQQRIAERQERESLEYVEARKLRNFRPVSGFALLKLRNLLAALALVCTLLSVALLGDFQVTLSHFYTWLGSGKNTALDNSLPKLSLDAACAQVLQIQTQIDKVQAEIQTLSNDYAVLSEDATLVSKRSKTEALVSSVISPTHVKCEVSTNTQDPRLQAELVQLQKTRDAMKSDLDAAYSLAPSIKIQQ
jgi:hypothetical protein